MKNTSELRKLRGFGKITLTRKDRFRMAVFPRQRYKFKHEEHPVQEELTVADHVFRACGLIVWIGVQTFLIILMLHKGAGFPALFL